MKHSEIADMNGELVAERKARLAMSAAMRARDDALRDAPLLDARRRTDPAGTARYLVKVAMRLQDGEKLGADLRSWLGNALIRTALDPTKAGAAFGLTARAHRPPADWRDIMFALNIVAKLLGDGVKPQTIAFARAGKRTGLSEAVVAREWRAYQRYLRARTPDI
jgi:hypothetical protein